MAQRPGPNSGTSGAWNSALSKTEKPIQPRAASRPERSSAAEHANILGSSAVNPGGYSVVYTRRSATAARLRLSSPSKTGGASRRNHHQSAAAYPPTISAANVGASISVPPAHGLKPALRACEEIDILSPVAARANL